MKETSKCVELRRARGDFDKYLCGIGIDIGCGDDPLIVPNGAVVRWDRAQGDAQSMPGVPDEFYDFAYSSHCLEHLRDIPITLANWTRIIKHGGWLYIVVPDFEHYEKLNWPSRFNSDHKHSFSQTVTRNQTGRVNHWHIERDLVPVLYGLGVTVERATLELDGYDPARGNEDQTLGAVLSQIYIVGQRR